MIFDPEALALTRDRRYVRQRTENHVPLGYGLAAFDSVQIRAAA